MKRQRGDFDGAMGLLCIAVGVVAVVWMAVFIARGTGCA